MKHKIIKRILSFGLVLSLLAGILPNNVVLPTNAEDSQTEIKDVYDYKEDFSGTQGANNWYYNSGDNTKYGKENVSEFGGSGENAYWSLSTSSKGTRISKNTFTFAEGYTGKAGIMFEIPKSGTIRIIKKFTVHDVDNFLVKYSIMKATEDADKDGTIDLEEIETPVFPTGNKLGMNFANNFGTYETYANEKTADIDVVTHVEAGERLVFSMQLNGVANGVVSLDTFTITYVEDVYDYTADFSDEQGKNNWYYNSDATLEYGEGNTTKYFEDLGVWASEKGGATHFGKDSINFTSINVAGIMFRAPKTGTIHIVQKINLPSDTATDKRLRYGIYKADSNTDIVGSVFPIGSLAGEPLQNNVSNYETYYYNNEQVRKIEVDINVQVEAGQQIVFAMTSNKAGVTATLDKFRITYVEEVYDYTKGFSGIQGMNNWYYNSSADAEYSATNTSVLQGSGEDAYWSSAKGAGTFFYKDKVTLAASTFSRIIFEAPKSGTIEIKKKIDVTGIPSGAVKYSIYKANQDATLEGALYPIGSLKSVNMAKGASNYNAYDTNNLKDDISVTTHVKEGQHIVFSMLYTGAGSHTVDLTEFTITYVEDVYDYTKDFSGIQGMNNWYYNSESISDYSTENTSAFQGSGENAYWSNAGGTGTFFYKDKATLAKNKWSRIIFEAPKSGTIRIEKKLDVSGITSGAVKYSIYKANRDATLEGALYPIGSLKSVNMVSGQSNYNAYDVNNPTANISVTTHVKEGQHIVFSMLYTGTDKHTVKTTDFKITYVEDVYDYTKDFSGVQGMNNWYYNPAQTTFEDSRNSLTNEAWTSSVNNAGVFGKDKLTAPKGGSWGTLAFKAPQSGWVRIEQKFTVSGGQTDKVLKYGIKKCNEEQKYTTGGTPLYPANMTGFMTSGTKNFTGVVTNATEEVNLTVQVEAGEYLVFGLLSTASTAYEVKLDKFTITYFDMETVELPAYQYSDGFSQTEQGPQWYYMSAEVGVNRFKELDYFNSEPNRLRWQTSETSEYLTGAIGNGFMAPWSTSDAILGFKVPYTGTVNITAGKTWLPSNSIDGVRFTILKGIENKATENLYPGAAELDTWKEIRPASGPEMKVSNIKVQKGEWIYFRVNANGTYNNDNLTINPNIQYVEIDTEDEGYVSVILSNNSYIDETKHTQAGHNMDAASFPMVARTSSGTKYNVTSDDFTLGLAHKTLSKGVYTITDGTLTLGKLFNNKEVDADGIYVNVANGVKLENVEGSRIKNLTVNVTGTPEALITTDSVRDLKLMGWQISYSGSSTGVELLKTTGTASNGDKADLVIDGLRFEGNDKVKGIKFTDAVHYGTLKNSYISGTSEYAVCDDGTSTEGIYVGNCYLEGDVKFHKQSGVAKYNTITGNVDVANDFGLVAMNAITGNITVSDVQSTFVTKNEVVGNITLTNGNACALVENTATQITVSGGTKSIVEDNNGAGEENKPVATVIVDTEDTEHYGSNVYDQSAREQYGANQDLLPKVDNTTFVGIERKDYVNDAGVVKTVSEYLTEHAENDSDVFLAPGAYNVNSVRITDKSNLNLYLYCSLFEAQTSRMDYFHLMLNKGTNCSVRGLTTAYAEAALGQGTIVEVGTGANGKPYFIVESHPGYYPDLSINDYYLEGFYCLTYREGSTVPSGYANFTGGREYLGNNQTKFTDTEVFGDVKVGDTFACRVRGNRYIQFHDNTECLMEDITAYSSVEALVGDDGGNKNYYNRLAAVVGFGYEISSEDKNLTYWQEKDWITEYNGKYYGPEAIWSVSNFLNANGCVVGPQVTNYVANQRHDDGFNVHGIYSKVKYTDLYENLSYAPKVAYDGSLSTQGTVIKDFKIGDQVFIYNKETGEILLETKATSATEQKTDDKGNVYYVVGVEACEKLESVENVVIFNASAHGHGFLYDNCELEMSYPRGGVIKASGTIKHCNIKDVGGIGILVSPEINETGFREAGYVDGLNLLYNNFVNTSTMNASKDMSSAISIQGYHKKIADGYVRHKNITIQGNRFANWGNHAIYVDSAENVKITDNIFVDDNARDDNRSAVYVTGSKNVAVFNNSFPENFNTNKTMRVTVDNANAVKTIIGIDKGTGDANSDSATDVRDLVRTQKYLLGEETTIDTDADYLEDGNYEETDLTALQELLVGIFKIPWEE